MAELVDALDLKSTEALNLVPVRFRVPAQFNYEQRTINKAN